MQISVQVDRGVKADVRPLELPPLVVPKINETITVKKLVTRMVCSCCGAVEGTYAWSRDCPPYGQPSSFEVEETTYL